MKVNKDVLDFIKTEKKAGTSDQLVKEALLGVGWDKQVIKNSFSKYYQQKRDKSIPKKKREKIHKKKVDKRSKSSNWVAWTFAFFMTLLLLAFVGGYAYYRYWYMPYYVEDYYSDINEKYTGFVTTVDNLETHQESIDLDFPNIDNINYTDPEYRNDTANIFEFIPTVEAAETALTEIETDKNTVKELDSKLEKPEICDTPLEYLDNRICEYHKDLGDQTKKTEDSLGSYKENLEYYNEILPVVNEIDKLLERQEDLSNPEKKAILDEEIVLIQKSLNAITIPDDMYPHKEGLSEILGSLKGVIGQQDASIVKKEAEAAQIKYISKLQETKNNLDQYQDDFQDIKLDQAEIQKSLDNLSKAYNFEIEVKEVEANDDKEELFNKTDITGVLNKNPVNIIYGSVLIDEDIFSNGEYYEWTFATNNPEKSCGFVQEENGIIFETREMEEGIYHSIDSQKPVTFISKTGEEREIPYDDFGSLYYYQDNDGNQRSIRGEWTGKFVINKIDIENKKIEGWLDVEYEQFVFGGEIRAEKSEVSGSFEAYNCVE